MRKPGSKLTAAARVQACAALLLVAGIIIAVLLPVSGQTQEDPLSGQLVVFTEADYTSPINGSMTFWRALQRHTTSFSSVAAFDQQLAPLDGARSASVVHVTRVTGNFFNTIRSRFLLRGPPLGAAEGLAYVSPEFWQREFGGAPDVIGQTLSIRRKIYCIAGVVATENLLEEPTDVWVLMKPPGSDYASSGKAFKFIARLHRDISWEAARADLKRFVAMQQAMIEQEFFAGDLCLAPVGSALFLPPPGQPESRPRLLHASLGRPF